MHTPAVIGVSGLLCGGSKFFIKIFEKQLTSLKNDTILLM